MFIGGALQGPFTCMSTWPLHQRRRNPAAFFLGKANTAPDSCYIIGMGFKARPSAERQLWDSLSPMPQKTALLLMRAELSREEMAEELGCGVKTFDTHRLAVMQHLGLASAAQLVHLGLRLGLVDVMPRPKARQR